MTAAIFASSKRPRDSHLIGSQRQRTKYQPLELSGRQHLFGFAERQRKRGVELQHTLPPTTAIAVGWTMGFATDNAKGMTVQVTSTSGGRILYPAGATGAAGSSVTLAAINYEFMALQFDGGNFRVVSITPRSAAALGMLGHQVMTGATPTVGSGSSDCGTSPSIGGNDSAGRITVGASNGGRCTITFVSPWPNPPVCSAFDETTGNLVRPTATSNNSVALIGMLAAGDSLVYQCVGFQ